MCHSHLSLLTHSMSAEKKRASCFKLQLYFKDAYFKADMYLDFTAKFDILQPLCLPPPCVTAVELSLKSLMWDCVCLCLQFEAKLETCCRAAPPNLSNAQMPLVSGKACQNIAFQCRESSCTPKPLGLLPENGEKRQ